jgi:hypothetical protein
MRKLRFLVPLTSGFLVAYILVACGTSPLPKGQLQSVTINPATASSQAQFTATGSYSDGSKVTPLPALWFPRMLWDPELNPVQWINLDETGKASCNGNAGTFIVFATAPVDPKFPLSKMDSATPQVSGTAQLSCP